MGEIKAVQREVAGFGKARYKVAFWGTSHLGSSGNWIACCAGLDIVTQGTTPEQAWDSLDDAIRMILRYYLDRGGVREWLKGLGFLDRGKCWVEADTETEIFLDWGPS